MTGSSRIFKRPLANHHCGDGGGECLSTACARWSRYTAVTVDAYGCYRWTLFVHNIGYLIAMMTDNAPLPRLSTVYWLISVVLFFSLYLSTRSGRLVSITPIVNGGQFKLRYRRRQRSHCADATVGPCVGVRFRIENNNKMKFAEHLAAHITPEWRKQYISYEVGHVLMTIVSPVRRTFVAGTIGINPGHCVPFLL